MSLGGSSRRPVGIGSSWRRICSCNRPRPVRRASRGRVPRLEAQNLHDLWRKAAGPPTSGIPTRWPSRSRRSRRGRRRWYRLGSVGGGRRARCRRRNQQRYAFGSISLGANLFGQSDCWSAEAGLCLGGHSCCLGAGSADRANRRVRWSEVLASFSVGRSVTAPP